MSRHLLVPMDDSEPARAALEYALSVFPDGDVTVAHAVDDLEAAYAGQSAEDARNPEFFADVHAIADEYGATVETTVLEGTPAESVLEYADERDVDGIVMGSEGRSGVSRMLLGSVAEQVAREASVPVTIVR